MRQFFTAFLVTQNRLIAALKTGLAIIETSRDWACFAGSSRESHFFCQQSVVVGRSRGDESGRYEYVIFSDSARKSGTPQYIDNRNVYGRITFAEDWETLEKEPWLIEFAAPKIS